MRLGWFKRRMIEPYSSIETRCDFQKIPDYGKNTLEIGPFYRPVVSGANVQYFDVLSSKQLRGRAIELGLDPSAVPDINFFSPNGDLSVVTCKFSNVVSAHCIEHQPDLIRHLHQVETILEDSGRYFLIIPDKRYCFDYTIPHSTLDEVLLAQGDMVHPLTKVIEHRAITTHNDASRHWAGDHFDSDWLLLQPDRARAAITEYVNAKGRYIDVHRWQFTPAGFEGIINALHSLKLSKLRVEQIHETPFNTQEFTAVLVLTT